MSKLQRIFEPIQIGRVPIPNRVVRTAHGTWIARGHINEELIAYHVARAKGGFGRWPVGYGSVAVFAWPRPKVIGNDHRRAL